MSSEKPEIGALWPLAKPGWLTRAEAFDPIVELPLCDDDMPPPAFRK